MVKEYTPIWNGFQFRNPTYIDGHFEPYKFDLVKWVDCEPYEVIDANTGEKKISTRYCYSVALLEWNKKDEYFNFKSFGLRYLENRIEGLEEWILEFCKFMAVYLEAGGSDGRC